MDDPWSALCEYSEKYDNVLKRFDTCHIINWTWNLIMRWLSNGAANPCAEFICAQMADIMVLDVFP